MWVLLTETFLFGLVIKRFVWDEAKYPTMSPLREIVDGIHGQVSKIEDDLKVINVNVVLIQYVGYLLFEGRCKE